MRTAILVLVAAALLLGVLTEAAYRRAAADSGARGSGRCVVLVLGYPSRSDGTPHPVQSFRVATGVAVYRQHRCGKLVLSGGAVGNEHIEAETMATIARGLGVPEDGMVLERRARNTWENIGCSTPHLRDADRVFVVSDSLHAQRARRYACRQDASRCSSFVAAGDNPPIEFLGWKVLAAANELATRVRDLLIYEQGWSANAPICGADGTQLSRRSTGFARSELAR